MFFCISHNPYVLRLYTCQNYPFIFLQTHIYVLLYDSFIYAYTKVVLNYSNLYNIVRKLLWSSTLHMNIFKTQYKQNEYRLYF